MNNKAGFCLEKSLCFSNGNEQLSLFGLSPYSSREEIENVSKKIYKDIISLMDNHQISITNAFSVFCSILKKRKVKVPQREKLQEKIRLMLIRAVEKVTYRQQYSDLTPKFYVSDKYLKWCSQFNNTSLYGYVLYKNSLDKKQYGRASNYLTRSVGLGSVAIKDGLTPYFLSITLDNLFHVSSELWNDLTPDQTAKMLTGAYSDFLQFSRNNNLRLESIRVVEPHLDGTPHLQAVIFIDSLKSDVVLESIKKVFTQKHGIANRKGIHFERCRDISKSIRYILKTFWTKSEHMKAWQAQVTRRFAITSNVRKVCNAGVFDAFRKEIFNSAIDSHYQDKVNARISSIADKAEYVLRRDGEHFLRFNHSLYLDKDDLCDELYSLLIGTTRDGDYAQFLRLLNNSFTPTKTCITQTLETVVTLDKHQLTELRTISKYDELRDSNILQKVYDIEDVKLILGMIQQKQDCKVKSERKEFLKMHFNIAV